MTIEERIIQLKKLIEDISVEHPDVATFFMVVIDAGENKDISMGGKSCARCMLDEFATFCLQNRIQHTEPNHVANVLEEIMLGKTVKH